VLASEGVILGIETLWHSSGHGFRSRRVDIELSGQTLVYRVCQASVTAGSIVRSARREGLAAGRGTQSKSRLEVRDVDHQCPGGLVGTDGPAARNRISLAVPDR
jgi:hypothetical protein